MSLDVHSFEENSDILQSTLKDTNFFQNSTMIGLSMQTMMNAFESH